MAHVSAKNSHLRHSVITAPRKPAPSSDQVPAKNPPVPAKKARIVNLVRSPLEGSGNQDPIRDIFLFCCFSGLRHSDVNNLHRSDVKGDHIEVTPFKDGKALSMGITPNVVMKWTGHSDTRP